MTTYRAGGLNLYPYYSLSGAEYHARKPRNQEGATLTLEGITTPMVIR